MVEGVRCLRTLRRNSTPGGSSYFGNVPLIFVRHDPCMDLDPTTDTARAALAARDRLERLAPTAARDERAGARIAEAGLFEEALLNALRAHFAELRTAAK